MTALLLAACWLLTAAERPARQLRTIRQASEERDWATVRYLKRLITEKRIPYHKLGNGKVLVDLADLDTYAERGRIEPAAPLRVSRLRVSGQ